MSARSAVFGTAAAASDSGSEGQTAQATRAKNQAIRNVHQGLHSLLPVCSSSACSTRATGSEALATWSHGTVQEPCANHGMNGHGAGFGLVDESITVYAHVERPNLDHPRPEQSNPRPGLLAARALCLCLFMRQAVSLSFARRGSDPHPCAPIWGSVLAQC